MFHYFAGLDWASTTHALAVVDHEGTRVLSLEFSHDQQGISAALDQLAKLDHSQSIPIAIERPDGLIVDELISAGHPVFPIHPNALNACRPRYTAASSKSDRGDAYILADVMRTDGHRLRQLHPRSDAIRALRALVRARDDLVAHRVAISNQLLAALQVAWPGACGLFSSLVAKISLAFLKRYPSAAAAKGLGPKRMEAFIKKNRYSGKKTAGDLLEHIKGAAKPKLNRLEVEAQEAVIMALVHALETLIEQISGFEKRIESVMREQEWGRIVMSLPRAGVINAAQILSEIGGCLERYSGQEALAAEGGVSPVTRASGKQHQVVFRRACNKRLRRALTTFAQNSRRSSEWADEKYQKARAEGKRHTHALRIVARAWCRVLWACLKEGRHYDPSSHRAAARLAG